MNVYTLLDDTGFVLALIDPEAYQSFVADYPTFGATVTNIQQNIARETCLTWGSGREDEWRIAVVRESTAVLGFRETTGIIRVTNNRLCLTSYDSLYATAMDELTLHPTQDDAFFAIPSGRYRCRIVQMTDPIAPGVPDTDADFDFLIEIIPHHATKDPYFNVRPEVRELMELGRFPIGDIQVSPETVTAYKEALLRIEEPVSNDEAILLCQLFNEDDFFCLAEKLKTLVESAPSWPLWEAIDAASTEWADILTWRAENAGYWRSGIGTVLPTTAPYTPSGTLLLPEIPWAE